MQSGNNYTVSSHDLMINLWQNLHSAREVHQFDSDVDELKSWMSEKEAGLDSEEQNHDLLSVQALIRQHEGLEVSLDEALKQCPSQGCRLVTNLVNLFREHFPS